MKPSKHYKPNSIYRDKAGTRYTITFKPIIHGYHMIRLQSNGDRICNSGIVFHQWNKELQYCGPLGEVLYE